MDETTKKVMEQIEKEQVTMRSRAYFTLRTTLFALGAIVTALFAVFIASFILFTLRLRGALLLPTLGTGGVVDLLLSLPFFILLFALLFTVVLWFLSKHYSFSYRKPVIFSVLGVIVLVIAGGYAVATSPLHPYFFQKFGHKNMSGSFMHVIYHNQGRAPIHNGIIGEVVNFDDSAYEVITLSNNYCLIIVNEQTLRPKEVLSAGDWLIARGVADDGKFNAFGIKKITADDFLLESIQDLAQVNHKSLASDCSQ